MNRKFFLVRANNDNYTNRIAELLAAMSEYSGGQRDYDPS